MTVFHSSREIEAAGGEDIGGAERVLNLLHDREVELVIVENGVARVRIGGVNQVAITSYQRPGAADGVGRALQAAERQRLYCDIQVVPTLDGILLCENRRGRRLRSSRAKAPARWPLPSRTRPGSGSSARTTSL